MYYSESININKEIDGSAVYLIRLNPDKLLEVWAANNDMTAEEICTELGTNRDDLYYNFGYTANSIGYAKNHKDKGMVFASGTPVSNSMTELYTMMRYLQTELLRDCGINHFDEWAADFGEVKTDYELKPESDGKYQLKTRFAKFTNLPELMGMFKEAADIRTADTLDLEKPISHVHEVVAQPSKIQRRLIKSLAKRASKIRDGKVDPKEDNMLCVTNDGRKIGLDQRLMQPGCPDNPNSKVNMCVQNVFDI